MYIVLMKTIGEVAFESCIKMSVGFRCDVPFDDLDLPFFSLSELFRDKGIEIADAVIGAAYPSGYTSIVDAVKKLRYVCPDCSQYIRRMFVNEHYIEKKGYSIRSLKAGQEYYAYISFDEEKMPKIKERIESITQLGIVDEGITGEVSLTISQVPMVNDSSLDLLPFCNYRSLGFTLMLSTPTCVYSPFSEGASTYLYIPGGVIKEGLKQLIGHTGSVNWNELRCANAYIGTEGKRLLPLPACVSAIKLEREQLRYRLSSDKRNDETEHHTNLSDVYSENVTEHLIRYVRPETEKIAAANGETLDALSPGQMFCGIIYGSDSEIRTIASHLNDNPVINLEMLSAGGYGEAYVKVTEVKEEDTRTEEPAVCFDICCLSDTLIIDDNGMAACREEELLREIERILGVSGKLSIVGKYTNICNDRSAGRAVKRCFAKGSVLRLRTTDGEPVNIAPIHHCFVGERTNEGYGELAAFPASDMYYRIGEELPPYRRRMEYKTTITDLNKGSEFTLNVLKSILRDRIRGLGFIDRSEYKSGIPADKLYPAELISMIKNRFDPSLSEDVTKKWYLEGLEENGYDQASFGKDP